MGTLRAPCEVGRAEELAELGRLLDDSRLVTVAGAGGVDKSWLAAHGAAALQVVFPLAPMAASPQPGRKRSVRPAALETREPAGSPTGKGGEAAG